MLQPEKGIEVEGWEEGQEGTLVSLELLKTKVYNFTAQR